MLHRVSFMLHRAKEILYKKESEIVRVRNTIPVLVNHSWKMKNIFLSTAVVLQNSYNQ